MASAAAPSNSTPVVNVQRPPAPLEERFEPPPGPPTGHGNAAPDSRSMNSHNPPVAPSAVPQAPPGMVAVPAAALRGNPGVGFQSGMMGGSGLAYGLGDGSLGTDMAIAGIGGNVIGQRYKSHEIRQAMADPYAPMVYVDEDSRAGRRALRRQRRQERRGKRSSAIAGFFSGSKSEGNNSSSGSSSEDGKTKTKSKDEKAKK